MWALIKREAEDMAGYVFAYLAGGGFLCFWLIYGHSTGKERIIEIVPLIARGSHLVICLASAAMGVSQMYLDRTKRISTFLVSHAVGRRHVFAARVIAGIFILLLYYLPVMAALFYAVDKDIRYTVAFSDLVFSFLTALGCYGLGLAMGCVSGKIVPSLGTLALVVILLTLVVIKGLSWDYLIVMGLFIAAAVGRAWQTFRQAAL